MHSINGLSSGGLAGGWIALIVICALAIVGAAALLALVLVARRRPELVPERIRGWVTRSPTEVPPAASSQATYPLYETTNSAKPAVQFGAGFEPNAN